MHKKGFTYRQQYSNDKTGTLYTNKAKTVTFQRSNIAFTNKVVKVVVDGNF